MSSNRGGGVKERSSTRTSVISKAMRTVDSNTRNEESLRRIRLLESDAYMEELMALSEGVVDTTADQAYSDDEDDTFKPKRKGRVKAAAGSKSKGKNNMLSKWYARKFKTFEKIVEEQGYDPAVTSPPNYLSVASRPSVYPRRHFCSICGYHGDYTCTRCGSRVCSLKCSESHKETVCLKFGY